MALLERIIDSSQPGECPDAIRDSASSFSTMLVFARSTFFKNPEYSEATLSRLRTELGSSVGTENVMGLEFADILASLANDRYEQYNLPESLEEAESYASQVADLPSSESLEAPNRFPELQGPVLDSYSITRMTEEIQQLESYSQILLQGPIVTVIVSIALQLGMRQGPTVPTIYRTSRSLSNTAGCNLRRYVPISGIFPSWPCRAFSSARSRKPKRLATSRSQSHQAMTSSS